MSASDSSEKKCGFIAIVGVPNAGKSTLTNALVGTKVSIVSRKVQTTRTRVMGILAHNNAQLILIDTPGVFTPKKTLERAMVKAAWDALPDADMILHLVDATAKDPAAENAEILERLPSGQPVFLVLNKVDKVNKPDLLALAQGFNERFSYAATFMVSSLKEQGLEAMLDTLAEHSPQGPWMFDEDQVSDMPLRLMAAEITREKIFERLHQELPYEIMVETESWEEYENSSVKISQVIFVQKESQKGIVVGKGGRTIKAIGEAARKDLEQQLERRVHLKLFAKVQENWSERAENYRLIGLDF
ncbi:MAG: GTPase Era [Alphaproteobacteria bacterium]|nr:GTPase Era [Alphaproteobacteria bacterium]